MGGYCMFLNGWGQPFQRVWSPHPPVRQPYSVTVSALLHSVRCYSRCGVAVIAKLQAVSKVPPLLLGQYLTRTHL